MVEVVGAVISIKVFWRTITYGKDTEPDNRRQGLNAFQRAWADIIYGEPNNNPTLNLPTRSWTDIILYGLNIAASLGLASVSVILYFFGGSDILSIMSGIGVNWFCNLFFAIQAVPAVASPFFNTILRPILEFFFLLFLPNRELPNLLKGPNPENGMLFQKTSFWIALVALTLGIICSLPSTFAMISFAPGVLGYIFAALNLIGSIPLYTFAALKFINTDFQWFLNIASYYLRFAFNFFSHDKSEWEYENAIDEICHGVRTYLSEAEKIIGTDSYDRSFNFEGGGVDQLQSLVSSMPENLPPANENAVRDLRTFLEAIKSAFCSANIRAFIGWAIDLIRFFIACAVGLFLVLTSVGYNCDSGQTLATSILAFMFGNPIANFGTGGVIVLGLYYLALKGGKEVAETFFDWCKQLVKNILITISPALFTLLSGHREEANWYALKPELIRSYGWALGTVLFILPFLLASDSGKTARKLYEDSCKPYFPTQTSVAVAEDKGTDGFNGIYAMQTVPAISANLDKMGIGAPNNIHRKAVTSHVQTTNQGLAYATRSQKEEFVYCRLRLMDAESRNKLLHSEGARDAYKGLEHSRFFSSRSEEAARQQNSWRAACTPASAVKFIRSGLCLTA